MAPSENEFDTPAIIHMSLANLDLTQFVKNREKFFCFCSCFCFFFLRYHEHLLPKVLVSHSFLPNPGVRHWAKGILLLSGSLAVFPSFPGRCDLVNSSVHHSSEV